MSTAHILILSEWPFTAGDAQEILGLHEGLTVDYHVIVPVDMGTGVLTRLLDDLSMLDLKQFVRDLKPQDHDEQRRTAEQCLATCLTALREARVAIGVDQSEAAVAGAVTEESPLTALGQAVEVRKPHEIVIVTRPHAVEDTLHTDWASVARETLGLPVLHLYGGTGRVG